MGFFPASSINSADIDFEFAVVADENRSRVLYCVHMQVPGTDFCVALQYALKSAKLGRSCLFRVAHFP